MNNKFILEKQMTSNNDSFVLDLSSIKVIENISLDLDNNLLQCNEAIENLEFDKAEDYLNIAQKLSEYGNKEINKTKNKMNSEKIKFLYSNIKGKDVSYYVEILLKIETFFNVLYSQHNLEMDVDLEEIIRDIKKIKENINIEDIINVSFENETGAIKKITSIKKFINDINNIENRLEIKNLNKNYENKINEIILNMKKSNLEEIKSLLTNTYEVDFLNSNWFIEAMINTEHMKLEKYDDLLEIANKSYLIYKFNKSISITGKMNSLYNKHLNEFMELPVLYKEHIVQEILEDRSTIYSLEEFFNIFIMKTYEKKDKMSKSSIPV